MKSYRKQFLKQIEIDFATTGFESDKARELRAKCRVSVDAIHKAVSMGKRAREARYEAHGYFAADSVLQRAAEAVKRHVSCGDRFDTPTGQNLLYTYHAALDARISAEKRAKAGVES